MSDNELRGSTECDRHDDEEAIRILLSRQVKAWDAGDPDAYASTYTAGGDCVSFLGMHYKGREAIAASAEVPPAASLFRKLARGARLDLQITQIQFLTSDLALVHATGGVTARAGKSRRTLRTNTTVAIRTSGGWLVAASQNTTRRPTADKLMTKLMSRRA
jgi:uncharacterized protein (TIGR02246 family)